MRADLAVTTPVTSLAVAPDPLLESTFEIPDPPPFMVTRPRLLAKLSTRADTPLSVVVGPAGSGKTQLVASWAATQAATTPVAWISLEDDADQTLAFWTYVIEALRRSGVPTSPVPSKSAATIDRSFLVRLAAELSGHRVPVVLVLDGVSSLAGEQWATDLEFVLRHAGAMLRLVLVGRWDPPLPLHRYRLTGRLTEVRSADLAFTGEEAAELLDLHGVEISARGLASLLEHTEGWAAGLRLFAMALQDRRDADLLVDTITGDEATIAEYFVDEVLRAQPAHVRSFLLEASVLETFTPELAEAVTGRSDARRLLLELERRNAFVQPVAEYSVVYRFHRLFAELLRAQLMCDAPDLEPSLHGRAAVWFAAQGQTIDAVSHAVKAGDWEAAATFTIDTYAIGRLILDGPEGRLGALLKRMPEQLENPEVAIVAAALALADGSVERCAHHLERAQDLVMRRGWQYSHAMALADLVVSMLLAAASGDSAQVLQTAAVATNFMAQTPPELLARHPELRVLTLFAKGIAQSRLGAVDAAAVTLTEATAVTAQGCEYPRIDGLQHLALIEAHRGRLGHAEKLAEAAIDLAKRYGIDPVREAAGAHVALAWVAMERYELDAAGHHLRLADPKQHAGDDGLAAAAFALVKSRRLQARGELRGAIQLLDEVSAAVPELRPPEWLTREIALSRIRLMIVSGRPDEALLEIRRFPEPQSPDVVVVHAAALVACGEAERAWEIVMPVASASGLPSPVSVEAWLVVATIAVHNGETEGARSALRHALRYAAGQRRALQQVWTRLRRVLRDDDDLAQLHRALQDSSQANGSPTHAYADPDTLVIVEPLSRREMEVLQGMAAMLATEEIAARLFVSINTVKTHVRSILRKLSASRRNEAVRRARALGLI
jgi:LuxR family transcriptional regulator, maltose regulon positive regulatory protein